MCFRSASPRLLLPAHCLSVPVLRSLVIEDSTRPPRRKFRAGARFRAFTAAAGNKLPEFVGEPPAHRKPRRTGSPPEAPAEPGHQASPSASPIDASGMSSQSTPAMTPRPGEPLDLAPGLGVADRQRAQPTQERRVEARALVVPGIADPAQSAQPPGCGDSPRLARVTGVFLHGMLPRSRAAAIARPFGRPTPATDPLPMEDLSESTIHEATGNQSH